MGVGFAQGWGLDATLLPRTHVIVLIMSFHAGSFAQGILLFDFIVGPGCENQAILVGLQSNENPKVKLYVDLCDGIAYDDRRRQSHCLDRPDGGYAEGTLINFRLELSDRRRRMEIGINNEWNEFPVFRMPSNQSFRPTVAMCSNHCLRLQIHAHRP